MGTKHTGSCALVLSSPPAGADPLRMKPLTKTRPLTKTGFVLGGRARVTRALRSPGAGAPVSKDEGQGPSTGRPHGSRPARALFPWEPEYDYVEGARLLLR